MAVDNQAVLVGARRQSGFLEPVAIACVMEWLGLRLPMIKAARDAHGFGGGMHILEMNRYQCGAWASGAVLIILVLHYSNPLCG